MPLTKEKASPLEIAQCVTPAAMHEQRAGQIGRTIWGVQLDAEDRLRRKYERGGRVCKVCPLGAYLLAIWGDKIVVDLRPHDNVATITARELSLETEKDVTLGVVYGFANAFDGVASIPHGARKNLVLDLEIGRQAAAIVMDLLRRSAT